jgi:hypothetical protein
VANKEEVSDSKRFSSGTMHALEMEEVESLVGARLAKKNKGNEKQDIKRRFLARLILGAVLLGLVVKILGSGGSSSANSDNEFNIDAAKPAGKQVETPPAAPIPTASTPSPVAANPVPAPVTPPVATPVATPAKPLPSSSSETSNVKFVYSNLATIVPLVDAHPPLDDKKKTELAEKWGHWHFWDGTGNRHFMLLQYKRPPLTRLSLFTRFTISCNCTSSDHQSSFNNNTYNRRRRDASDG